MVPALSQNKQKIMMSEHSLLFYFFSSLALVSGMLVIRSKNPVHSVLFLILVFCNVAGLLILLNLDFFAMIFLVVYVGAIAVLFLFVVMMLHIKIAEIHENVLRYLPVGGFIGFIFLFEVLLVIENDLIPFGGLDWWMSMNQVHGPDFASVAEWLGYKLKGIHVVFDPNLSYREYSQDLQKLTHVPEAWAHASSALSEFYFYPYTEWMRQVETQTNLEALGQVLYTYYFYFFLLASLILLIAMMGAITLTLHPRGAVRRQEVYEQNLREYTQTIQKVRV